MRIVYFGNLLVLPKIFNKPIVCFREWNARLELISSQVSLTQDEKISSNHPIVYLFEPNDPPAVYCVVNPNVCEDTIFIGPGVPKTTRKMIADFIGMAIGEFESLYEDTTMFRQNHKNWMVYRNHTLYMYDKTLPPERDGMVSYVGV